MAKFYPPSRLRESELPIVQCVWRGNKSGQAPAVRVSKTNHSLGTGIYAVDLAARLKKNNQVPW
jgi:hypothetical protein